MARYLYDCSLRWSDLDAFGHVNNARFLTLYEEARVALMFTAASGSGLTSMADGVVIARHEIDYLRPVGFTKSVRIEMWIEEIRNSSFVVAYELFDAETIASRSRSVLVPFDLATQRPRRLSEAERSFLGEYLEASPVTTG